MNAPEQLVLLSEPRARHDDPESSRAAAAKVKPNNQKALERVAQIVDDAGPWGACADEIWQRMCVDDPYWLSRKSTVHGQVSRAAKAGLIVPNGGRRLSVLNCVQDIHIHPRHQRGERNG